MNDYFALGIREDRVSFRSVWYDNKGNLRPEFASRPNLPLRGLFWVSKDLFEPETGFRDAMAPTARRLHELRIRLEHRYVKIYEGSHWGELEPGESAGRGLDDTLAYFVPWSKFDGAALEGRRLVRAAPLYLGLTIGEQERSRADARPRPPSDADAAGQTGRLVEGPVVGRPGQRMLAPSQRQFA